MPANAPRFSVYTRSYTWFFLFCLCFLPLWVILAKQNERALPFAFVWAGIAWPVLITALLGYARSRCASPALRYADGLFYVTASMITGWGYITVFIAFPALVITVALSVLFSVYGDIRRNSAIAPAGYGRIVRFFYTHRMRQ